ncbi:MAG: S-layer homology domain-containing protein [Clostridia bacterium]|nr:S-layer homology domain-containing protein [Clostridia bacterium]
MKLKHILCAALAALMLAGSLPVSAATDPYWAAQAEYKAAISSGDYNRIIKAGKAIEAIYPNLANKTELDRVMTPILAVAESYASLGQFRNAAVYYQKYLKITKLYEPYGITVAKGTINSILNMIEHDTVKPTVYAKTADTSNIPYYGARNEPVAGTYTGMCDSYDASRDSAYLLYVLFGPEEISKYDWAVPKDDPDLILTLAWNVPNETLSDLEEVASGVHDAYIKRNLEYLNGLNCRVMIRFGAEVNCWASMPSTQAAYDKDGAKFADTFKKAFRRVADIVHQECPGAAMVFSPNEISGWYFDHTDFYPGDEYVDWVGMSTYGNAKAAEGILSSFNDAYNCVGYYENQLTRIKSIVETYGDRKPIIISECGFCYRSETDWLQNEPHAIEAMRFFLTYLTMVYPQVKTVNYFNTNFKNPSTGKVNYYALFPGRTNETVGRVVSTELANLYTVLMDNNPAVQYSLGSGNYCGYTELGNIDEPLDSLDMSVYAWYPTSSPVNVEYALDTVSKLRTASYPYSYSIGTDTVSVGTHLVSVSVKCLAESEKYVYTLKRGNDGVITVKNADLDKVKDVKKTDWFYDYVAYCMSTGLLNGVGGGRFEPETKLNRAMFVTILGRMAGVDASKYTNSPFSDVPAGQWYTPYVAWAKETGVVNGVSATRFDPEGLVTREQICAMIIRYADAGGIVLPETAGGNKFADDSIISDWAKGSVYRAQAAGIVNGKEKNRFDPLASATRAEGATIFMRLVLMLQDLA